MLSTLYEFLAAYLGGDERALRTLRTSQHPGTHLSIAVNGPYAERPAATQRGPADNGNRHRQTDPHLTIMSAPTSSSGPNHDDLRRDSVST
jgi:hypothetical protein